MDGIVASFRINAASFRFENGGRLLHVAANFCCPPSFQKQRHVFDADYHATAQGRLDVSDLLPCLAQRTFPDVDAIGGPLGTAVRAAHPYGHVEIVKELVHASALPFFCSDEYGNVRSTASHPRLLRWLMVDRFVEQWKLCS